MWWKKNLVLKRLGYQRYKFEKQSPIFFRIGFAKIKHIHMCCTTEIRMVTYIFHTILLSIWPVTTTKSVANSNFEETDQSFHPQEWLESKTKWNIKVTSQLMKLVIIKKFLLSSTTRKGKRTVWRIFMLMLMCKGFTILLQEYLYIAPLHVQLEATKSFSSIIQNGTIPAYMFSSSFLPIILHNIDNRDNGECKHEVSCALVLCKLCLVL